MKLKVALIHPLAVMPKYAHEGDSGLDIAACEDVAIEPHSYAKVHTGVCFEPEEGYELQLRPRSGMASRGLVAAFGTIDNGYRGEVQATIYNHTDFAQMINCGDRIAQVVPCKLESATVEIASELCASERGVNGFGSSGR